MTPADLAEMCAANGCALIITADHLHGSFLWVARAQDPVGKQTSSSGACSTLETALEYLAEALGAGTEYPEPRAEAVRLLAELARRRLR